MSKKPVIQSIIHHHQTPLESTSKSASSAAYLFRSINFVCSDQAMSNNLSRIKPQKSTRGICETMLISILFGNLILYQGQNEQEFTIIIYQTTKQHNIPNIMKIKHNTNLLQQQVNFLL